MTTNSSSKRDQYNNGGDTGAGNPTASQAYKPHDGSKAVPNTGVLSNGFIGTSAPPTSPKSVIQDK